MLKLRGEEADGQHAADRQGFVLSPQGNDQEFRTLAHAEVVAAVGQCGLLAKLWQSDCLVGCLELGYRFNAEKPGQGARA